MLPSSWRGHHSSNLCKCCLEQGEVKNLRSNELMELQQRMAAAMQRIAELEATVQRGGAAAGPRPVGMDDTRSIIRDNKSRRTPRMSPRSSLKSPIPDANVSSQDNVKLRTRQVGMHAVLALQPHINQVVQLKHTVACAVGFG